MKTYEVWADIVGGEGGVQIDDVGDPALMGTFRHTGRSGSRARIRMVDVRGLRELCQRASGQGNLARSAERA